MGWHGRLSLKTIISDRFIVEYGIDHLFQQDHTKVKDQLEVIEQRISRSHSSAFLETDYFLSKNLAFKAGLRATHHSLLNQTSFAPRFTIAQKLAPNSQISAAYGQYRQEVASDFLYHHPNLSQEKATHYLLNFNHKTDKQILRLETYYKRYQQLIKYQENVPFQYENITNEGVGYAYGLDLFWRANQLFENLDFWVSYSWIEHQRHYRNFLNEATPDFSTAHNASVVTKFWMPKLKSQLGVTCNITSGRPYENPNTAGFLNERSKIYKSINLSWAYLLSPQKILFFSISNAPGFQNNFGYEYGHQIEENGLYPGRLIRPNNDQFFFIGFFWTISSDKSRNQLDHL